MLLRAYFSIYFSSTAGSALSTFSASTFKSDSFLVSAFVIGDLPFLSCFSSVFESFLSFKMLFEIFSNSSFFSFFSVLISFGASFFSVLVSFLSSTFLVEGLSVEWLFFDLEECFFLLWDDFLATLDDFLCSFFDLEWVFYFLAFWWSLWCFLRSSALAATCADFFSSCLSAVFLCSTEWWCSFFSAFSEVCFFSVFSATCFFSAF